MAGFLSVAMCLLFAVASAELDEKYPFFPHSREDEIRINRLVEEINAMNLTWKAEYNPLASLEPGWEPLNIDEDSQQVFGMSFTEAIDNHFVQETEDHWKELASFSLHLPTSFDARDKWTECPSVQHIQNQGGCGSCWAAASTGSITDRLCISSNFSQHQAISLQDLVSCCGFCGNCQGGSIEAAFLYWKMHGIVSGGSFGSNQGCRPYEIPSTCGSPCPGYFYKPEFNPKCERECQTNFQGDYESELGRGKRIYLLSDSYRHGLTTNELALSSFELTKREIFLHGPVAMCVREVQEPFAHYRSGIYTRVETTTPTSGNLKYGHCMKLIGWGEENGNEYWTVANSWGRNWGENGFGRISVNYDPYMTVVAGLW